MSTPWDLCNTDTLIDRLYYYGGTAAFTLGIIASLCAVFFLVLSVVDYDIPALDGSSKNYFLKAIFFAVVLWALYNMMPFC